MAVVKAGAYGHGLEPVAQAIASEGVAFFGVANVGEARRLRNAGVSEPIYLLGATWEAEHEEIVARDWVPCISTLEEARHFDALARAAGKKLTIHLAVDTGMGRGGVLPGDAPAVMAALEGMSGLEIDGIGSHLPSADEDEEFTRQQIAVFERVVESLGGADRFRWKHLLNSAGLLAYGCKGCNLVRPGLMLYGVSPVAGHDAKLRTVMSLKSRVTLVRELPAGHGVSYGRSYVTTRPTLVATVGIGYGDGLPRQLSGTGAEVWLRGMRVPVIGRVTMDQIMLDASAVPGVAAGDEVEIFGPNIAVTEVASKAGTIPWEVFTGITPRVERHYLEGGLPFS